MDFLGIFVYVPPPEYFLYFLHFSNLTQVHHGFPLFFQPHVSFLQLPLYIAYLATACACTSICFRYFYFGIGKHFLYFFLPSPKYFLYFLPLFNLTQVNFILHEFHSCIFINHTCNYVYPY